MDGSGLAGARSAGGVCGSTGHLQSSGFTSRALSSLRGRVDRLLLLLPDQLHSNYLQTAGLDPGVDAVLQIELDEDFTHVPSHRQRSALFLSAMRHFAAEIERAGWRSAYIRLEDRRNDGSLSSQLERAWRRLRPGKLVVFRPGDIRTLSAPRETADGSSAELELLEDPHFFLQPAEFETWADGRKSLLMEHFYRWMRRRLGILLTTDGKPEGGSWNYDSANRQRLGDDGRKLPRRFTCTPDAITQEVLRLVAGRFSSAPGRLESFAWPVTRSQALKALRHFIRHCLPWFGDYQDAMQTGEPWLFHSLLSPPLNLKLLDLRECVEAALEAYRNQAAPLSAVEGFSRQIIGWREFIRGIYWREGPAYSLRNHLDQHGRLPDFYWTGQTDLNGVHQALAHVLEHGHGHHIQRLMVTGNPALISGVHPKEVSEWYLGMYIDALESVTLPNTAGMVMFADGGVLGSKPYAASGRYIERMSDSCSGCRFEPGERTGKRACPVTTL